jgi:peptide deformylase
MAILDIITEPNDALHQVSREVRDDEFGETLSKKLSDMASTMYANGGVGLAGPQVGDFRRILVADIGYAETLGPGKIAGKYGVEMIKMVNPTILWAKGSIEGPEGCLSVPDFQQTVERNDMLAVEFQNEFGEKQEMLFEGYVAVIIQHEIDHLDGVTLLTRAGRLKRSRYLKKQKNDKKNRKALGS